jgi:glucokinase
LPNGYLWERAMMASEKSNESVYIALDLGGAARRGAIVSAAGAVIHETHTVAEHRGSEQLLEQMVELVRHLRAHPEASDRVAALGVGVPGLVNSKTNRIEILPNLPELTQVDVAAELAAQTGLPVVLNNDVNAAAYAELQVGAAKSRKNVFYASLGIGIGAGIIIDGQIYRGATGFAGEFGHMTIDPEGIECACGNIGCLETICSGPNIVRRTRERLYRDRTSSLSRLAIPRDRELAAEDIARAAREGDEMAQVMMERTGMFLGIALAAVINLLNVEMIVLGGGVMEAGELILKPTVKETRRRAFPPSFNSCEIVIAKLGTSAGLTGAALLARDSIE